MERLTEPRAGINQGPNTPLLRVMRRAPAIVREPPTYEEGGQYAAEQRTFSIGGSVLLPSGLFEVTTSEVSLNSPYSRIRGHQDSVRPTVSPPRHSSVGNETRREDEATRSSQTGPALRSITSSTGSESVLGIDLRLVAIDAERNLADQAGNSPHQNGRESPSENVESSQYGRRRVNRRPRNSTANLGLAISEADESPLPSQLQQYVHQNLETLQGNAIVINDESQEDDDMMRL